MPKNSLTNINCWDDDHPLGMWRIDNILLCQVKPECGVIVLGNQPKKTSTKLWLLKTGSWKFLALRTCIRHVLFLFLRAIALSRMLSSIVTVRISYNTPKV